MIIKEGVELSNGYSNFYAYPQQYFDKAFLGDANGNITTNQTGILSEYGEFFPTQPGKIFLTTKPDGATGSTGQCIVYAIKIELDVNHDGLMDSSFTGQDNTSSDRPFHFWVNNDADIPAGVVGSTDADYNYEPPFPDYNFNSIPSQRDLEDYARLWLAGLPALWSSNGYQVTLSWNITSGNPSIKLFSATETNGGIAYLTNVTTAAAQINPSTGGSSIGTVASTFTFFNNFFTNINTRYFLFEGAGIGQGELVLNITQSGTNVASTSVFIDLKDVKDLFEHADAENVTASLPPSSLVSYYALGNILPPNPTESKQMIIFVHGINNTPWDYENTSETMFKRLYWAGYQGRFSAFRWPCAYLPPARLIHSNIIRENSIPGNLRRLSRVIFRTCAAIQIAFPATAWTSWHTARVT